jgi:hypothetical protein
MPNVKSMENLEKLEQLIGKIPARNWAFYAKKLGWSRGKVYEYFNSLEIKEKAYSKGGLWYPQTATSEKPSTDSERSKKQLGFFERREERRKLEEEERRLAVADETDMVGDMFPSLSPLKAVSKMTRKQIKESRKQREKEKEAKSYE